eukprot:scaffold18.g1926.t1
MVLTLAGGSGTGAAFMAQQASGGVPPLSRATSSMRRRTKLEVASAFLQNLRERGGIDVDQPGFAEGLQEHFESLPSRYALDVNINSLDVLNHKRLLDSARADPSAVSFQVRPVDVGTAADVGRRPSFGSLETLQLHHPEGIGQLSPNRFLGRPLPRPAFGSSPNLQALVLEAEERREAQTLGDKSLVLAAATFYEVTIASIDQPKLLSRLSESLGDLGLNICEAHAFNTKDHFSLDVFVVNGWTGGGTEELEDVLSRRLQELPPPVVRGSSVGSAAGQGGGSPLDGRPPPEQRVPAEEVEELAHASTSAADNDWELDPNDIIFHEKIASGAFGDLFRGTYCGQDVAIKILRNVHDDSQQFQEFLQEVAIMRKVRHKNVVQFIGACTQKPNLCIVFEFMSGGSVYDYIRRAGPLRVATVLKIALEVGCGVGRVGEAGWMAPEVIEHNPYREKADTYSFGIVLWELLTGRIPYSDMTPLQAAVAVVQKGLRPPIPQNCPPPLADIMRLCWQRNADMRPSFEQLKAKAEELYAVYRQQDPAAGLGLAAGGGGVKKAPSGGGGGLLARLRSGSSSGAGGKK